MMETQKKKIVVLGSLNYDVFLKMNRLPVIGETMAADDDVMKAFGGKGANQAVSCARLCQLSGCEVVMLGQVGSDEEGNAYLNYLAENKVKTKDIKVLSNMVTGQAFIFSINKTGENSIVIIGGANQAYKEANDLPQEWENSIRQANVLLMQREVPEHVNVKAARIAQQNGCQVILDVGGSDLPLSHELLQELNFISPNETEL